MKEVVLDLDKEKYDYKFKIKELHNQGTNIVLCPLTPMDFEWYNLNSGKVEYQAQYGKMTEFLITACAEMNWVITNTNNANGVLIPCSSREVLNRPSWTKQSRRRKVATIY